MSLLFTRTVNLIDYLRIHGKVDVRQIDNSLNLHIGGAVGVCINLGIAELKGNMLVSPLTHLDRVEDILEDSSDKLSKDGKPNLLTIMRLIWSTNYQHKQIFSTLPDSIVGNAFTFSEIYCMYELYDDFTYRNRDSRTGAYYKIRRDPAVAYVETYGAVDRSDTIPVVETKPKRAGGSKLEHPFDPYVVRIYEYLRDVGCCTVKEAVNTIKGLKRTRLSPYMTLFVKLGLVTRVQNEYGRSMNVVTFMLNDRDLSLKEAVEGLDLHMPLRGEVTLEQIGKLFVKHDGVLSKTIIDQTYSTVWNKTYTGYLINVLIAFGLLERVPEHKLKATDLFISKLKTDEE